MISQLPLLWVMLSEFVDSKARYAHSLVASMHNGHFDIRMDQ